MINLKWGLRLSSISDDNGVLYLFDEYDASVSHINLDKLTLDQKSYFEAEGPDGIGVRITNFQALSSGNLTFISSTRAKTFSQEGELIQDIDLNPAKITGLELGGGANLTYNSILSEDGKYFFSLPGSYMRGTRDLAVIESTSSAGKIIDIPAMDVTFDSRIILKGEMVQIYMEEIYLQNIENKLYIVSSATSDLYRYDYEMDSMELFSFPITVTEKAKNIPVKNDVSSLEEFNAEREKVANQIGFRKLIWDEAHGLLFRFGTISLPKNHPDDEGKEEVYLYAFDTNMRLVGETRLNKLTEVPEYSFFKEGKLWSYVNVEDELGFAVFTFDF